MSDKIMCGTQVGEDSPPGGHLCSNVATRISHIYDGFSVYVCDLDHNGLEPWQEDTIERLSSPGADE